LHSLFSGKDRDLKIQRQRVLYRGLTIIPFYYYQNLLINKIHQSINHKKHETI